MSFFERHGIVRATQWHKHGDHPHVQPGRVHSGCGTLDLGCSASYAKRHVEPGDWIVVEGDGRHIVVTDAEFRNSYKGTI